MHCTTKVNRGDIIRFSAQQLKILEISASSDDEFVVKDMIEEGHNHITERPMQMMVAEKGDDPNVSVKFSQEDGSKRNIGALLVIATEAEELRKCCNDF